MDYNLDKKKALAELTYKDIKHHYTWKGYRVASVTSVIDFILLPFLRMPERLLVDAKARGTEVHKLTEDWDKGDRGTVSTSYVKYLEAWWKFLADTGFKAIEIENMVLNTHYLYAGRPDRVGFFGDDLAVVDIKTGVAYPEYGLQTAAYMEALNEGVKISAPKVKRRLSVQLKPDGTYALHEYHNKTDINVFLGALTVYNWKGKVSSGAS